MPNNTHKSAAVPFVNHKGERSMKRVKVERYVAGKKPAYANDDEEEEYFTTDDEQDYDGDREDSNLEAEEAENDQYYEDNKLRTLDHFQRDSDDESGSSDEDNEAKTGDRRAVTDLSRGDQASGGSEDEDDPRFRRLKQIESTSDVTTLINVQRKIHQIKSDTSSTNIVLDEDDDEEEIRQRHALARRRELGQPLGLQAVIGDDNHLDLMQDEDDQNEAKQVGRRLDTDDLLRDLKLTGISKPMREKLKTEEEKEAEQRRLKEMIEQAKQEASFQLEVQRKVDEDIKREIEREALAKGDIGAREMTTVNTDDEDDELAYEEWKLREIKRVLRDRSERQLALAARVR